MNRIIARVSAAVVLVVGLALCWVCFLVGATVAGGAPWQDPVGTVCVDPWVEAHPGDFEPDVEGSWSWWPPGVTCRHADGEVYVEPTTSDAVAVSVVGLTVLALGVAPTVIVARGLWRSGLR